MNYQDFDQSNNQNLPITMSNINENSFTINSKLYSSTNNQSTCEITNNSSFKYENQEKIEKEENYGKTNEKEKIKDKEENIGLTSSSLEIDDSNNRFSYIRAIAEAIMSSPKNEMLLCDLYTKIISKYPELKSKRVDWQNGIRHNLSLNECFVKLKRNPNGKGHYWGIEKSNLAYFVKNDFRRRWSQTRTRYKRNEKYLNQNYIYHDKNSNKMLDFQMNEPYSPFYFQPFYNYQNNYKSNYIDMSQCYNCIHKYPNYEFKDIDFNYYEKNYIPLQERPIFTNYPYSYLNSNIYLNNYQNNNCMNNDINCI